MLFSHRRRVAVHAASVSGQPIRCFALFAALFAASPGLYAANITWTTGGASDGLWATGASWLGGAALTTGDSVFFGATTGTTTLTYDIANTAPAWGGITFNSGASAYTISGGTMTMAGGTAAITNSSTNAQVINSVFASGFTVAGSGGLTLGGQIVAGNITKNGTGTLTLTGNNTYTGSTAVNAGTLTYAAAASSANSDLTVGAAGAGNAAYLTISNTGGTRTMSKSLTFNGAVGANASFNLSVTNSGSTASVLNFGPLTVQAGFAILNAGANASANQKWNFDSLTINNGGMIHLQRVTGAATLGGNTNNGTLNVIFASAPSLIGTGSAGTTSVGIVAGVMAGSYINFVTYDANGLRNLNTSTEQATLASGMTSGQNAKAAASGTTTLSVDTTVNSLQILAGSPTIALSGKTLTVTSGMLAGATNNGVGTQTIGSAVGDGTLQFGGANAYIVSDAKNTLVINSTIAGTGGLTLAGVNSGANQVATVLAGANTISGTARMIGNYSTTVRLTNSLALQNLTLDYNNYGASFTFGWGGTTGLTDYTFGGLQGAQNIALTNNSTPSAAVALTVGGNGDSTTYSGVLSGAGGSLIKAGAGSLTLTAANTYTGSTTISSGTLQIGDSGTTGSLSTSSAITNNGVLVFNRSNALTQGTHFSSAAISGTGSLIKSGTGSLTLNVANTFSGNTRVNAGVLSITNASGLQNSTLDLNGSDSGTVSFSQDSTLGGLTGSRNFDMGGRTFSIGNNDQSTAYSGILSNGALTKIGAGTLTLSAANTYTGTTTLSAGTLRVGNGSTTGGLSASSTISIGLGATLAFNRTDAYGGNFANAISGSGGVTLLSGSLTFSTAKTYTGQTRVSGGVLALGVADAISNQSSLLVDGGGFDLAGYSDTVAGVTITSGSIFGAGTLTAATYGLGGGRVAANLGAGTLNVTANSALDGPSAATAVNLNSGALTLGSGSRFTASSVAVSGSSGASLTLGGNEAFGSLAGAANVALGSNTLSVGAANTDTTYSGVLSGAGGLTKVGSGVFTLANANTYTGPTQVSAGTLLVGAANAIASTSAITLGSASSRGILEVDHDVTISSLTFSGSGGDVSEGSTGMVTLSAASGPAMITVLGGSNAFHANATLSSPTVVDVSNGGFFSFHNDLFGGATLTKQGLGTMALAGVNEQLSGNFFITAGRVNIGSGYKQIGTGTTTVSGGATLDLNGHAFTNTINLISGTILNQGNSAATTTIGGTSTISGAIEGTYDINSGGVATFASGFGTGTSTVDVNVNNGGRATFNGGVSGLADVTVNAGGRATFNSTLAGGVVTHGTSTFNGALLSGANAEVHGGLATFTAATAAGSTVSVQSAGSAVFSGGVAGLVEVMGSATFDSTSGLTGTLYTGTTGVVTLDNMAATITGTLHNDGQLVVNRGSGSQTISGYLYGSGLVRLLSGSLTLSGSNAYSGGTWIDGGTLTAGHLKAFGTGAITLASGATLDLANLLVTNAITNNGGTIRGGVITGTTSVSGNTTLDGTVAGTVTLTNNSSATIGGNVTSAAVVTVVASSTVTAAAGSSFAAGSTVSNLGQFIVNTSGTTPFAANMTGNGAFLVNGGGKVRLTGSNAGFSGQTTVTGQDTTLAVNSVLGGDVLVGAGASLGGSGLIAGDIGGDGLIGPGNSPGILTVNGQLAATGSTSFAFELSQTGPPNWSDATNSSNDVLRLTASSPFASSLANTNVVNVYFDVADLNNGDTFLGGFFVDNPASTANLLTSGLGTASFQYFVYGDGNGGYVYNNIKYYSFDDYKALHSGITGVTQSVVNVASASFSGGSAITTGQVTQFVIIPEPDTIIFAGIGIAMAGWSVWKRRRIAKMLQDSHRA